MYEKEKGKSHKTLHPEYSPLHLQRSIEGQRVYIKFTDCSQIDPRILEVVRIAVRSGNGAGLGISVRNDGRRPTAIGRHCQRVLSTAGQIGRRG